MEPVYGPDRLLLPAGVKAEGVISATPAAERSTRVNAKLDGDFTPLRVPVIRVTQLVLPSGTALPVDAVGGMRNAETISLAAHPRPTSLAGRIKAMAHAQIQQVHELIHNPHKGDWAKQLLYRQLPYHPQTVWAGSQFDAVLREPLRIPVASASAPMPAASAVDLTSGTHAGAADERHQLRIGETRRPGQRCAYKAILQFAGTGHASCRDAAARAGATDASCALVRPQRTPALRFSFYRNAQGRQARQQIESSLSSIQGQKGQNVAMDSEGGTRAQPDKGRFMAPLVLGVSSRDCRRWRQRRHRCSTASPAMALASPRASSLWWPPTAMPRLGFAIFATAKSIYRRFIARGHEVSFPANTEMSIDLSKR